MPTRHATGCAGPPGEGDAGRLIGPRQTVDVVVPDAGTSGYQIPTRARRRHAGRGLPSLSPPAAPKASGHARSRRAT